MKLRFTGSRSRSRDRSGLPDMLDMEGRNLTKISYVTREKMKIIPVLLEN